MESGCHSVGAYAVSARGAFLPNRANSVQAAWNQLVAVVIAVFPWISCRLRTRTAFSSVKECAGVWITSWIAPIAAIPVTWAFPGQSASDSSGQRSDSRATICSKAPVSAYCCQREPQWMYSGRVASTVPKHGLRGLLTLLAFLLVLTIVVGSGAVWLDKSLGILIWGAFLVGSIVIIVKSIQRGQTGIYGQLSALPRSWRRWVLDEPETRTPDQRANSADRHGS